MEHLDGGVAEADEAGDRYDVLAAANINPATGLATDYLNHFNEITMLLGLVADMPEVIVDIRDWRPATYEEHFRRSGFKAKGLAIEAYRASAPHVRKAFDGVVAELDESILDAVATLEAAPLSHYARIVAEAESVINPLMARAAGIIHGVEFDTDLFAPETTQGTVDALFM